MGRISSFLDGIAAAWDPSAVRRGGSHAPVSAVIGVSLFDVPYLAATLPHLLRQSRFSFGERLVVVDPRTPKRPRRRAFGRPAELERLVNAARDAGTIDRVVELDTREAAQRRVGERYFEPGRATDGSADQSLYAALFGLEAARHDVVAWFEADLLFHTSGESWVAAGLNALARDPDLWLVTTDSGPPRDPPLPRWAHALLRLAPRPAPTGSSRHFLSDRRRLHGQLRRVTASGDHVGSDVAHAPRLPRVIDALEHRGALGILDDTWHLHPRSHRPPFPQWIDRLVDAVERGEIPPIQRDGCLRLDDAASRSAWRKQLFASDDLASRGVMQVTSGPRPVANLIERRAISGPAPISIVIPIRNRAGSDVRNALASLAWQTSGPPWEVIIVSHGSDPAVDAELRSFATGAGATLITVGSPSDAWCKPLALNTGILATDPAISFVMAMDGDMILAENMLATVLEELRSDPQRIVLCQSSDLPEDCVLPADTNALRAQFAVLQERASLRGIYGTGGIQAVRRSFLFDVHGYDEDMLWWGALDTDLVRRAEAAGLRASWVTNRTAMLHQWHPRKHRVLDEASRKDAAQSSWLRNHELMLERAEDVVRNHDGWGAAISRERHEPVSPDEARGVSGSPR